VKAALGCFDERRLLLGPSWAEMSSRVLAYRLENFSFGMEAKRFEGGPACGLA
jgi:hypothetical protein